jgi:hypothetical protein
VIERSDTEEVDALVVLDSRPASHALVRRSAPPAVQTAAVAAGGLVIGALLTRILGRRRERPVVAGAATRRLLARRRPEPGRAQVVASRSLLVDVHLLGSPSRSR